MGCRMPSAEISEYEMTRQGCCSPFYFDHSTYRTPRQSLPYIECGSTGLYSSDLLRSGTKASGVPSRYRK